jgi:hypothetical protein
MSDKPETTPDTPEKIGFTHPDAWKGTLLIVGVIGFIIYGIFKPAYVDQKVALKTCFDVWDAEAYGINYRYYTPITFVRRRAIETGDNQYRAVVEFKLRGGSSSQSIMENTSLFACDVFLQGGKVKYRIINNGGLRL